MRKNKKNMFYLTMYVSFILLLFGGVLINQLAEYVLETRKTPDYKDISAVIKNATNNYIQKNPDLKNKLFFTNKFVDIDVKTLIDSGFIKGALYNSSKGENISLDEKIRITATNNNLINVIYPVKNENEGYHFVVSDLILKYGETTSFCDDPYMLYKGLFSSTYEGITKYKMGLVNYSNNNSEAGIYYTQNYFGDPINLKVKSCNVDTSKAGTYEVYYEYTDFDKNIKNFKRKVTVKRNERDIDRFKAYINDDNIIGYKDNQVGITITEKSINNNVITNNYLITNVDGTFKILDESGAETDYTIEYFTTEKLGKNMSCVIKSKKINSDGKGVPDFTVKYSVELPRPNNPTITRENNELKVSGNEDSVVETSIFYGCTEKKQEKTGNTIKISSKCKTYYIKACNTSKCSNIIKYSVE